jgi:protein MpaA
MQLRRIAWIAAAALGALTLGLMIANPVRRAPGRDPETAIEASALPTERSDPDRTPRRGEDHHSSGRLGTIVRKMSSRLGHPEVAWAYGPEIIGRAVRGRPIRLTALGRPALDAKVLVVGCIHGTECAGRTIKPLGHSGCPSDDADIYFLRNLNPDGYALGTRLNGRGVDLNRNFPAGWKPIGHRRSPQYSGPRPFSEPETRLAANLIRRLHPKVTIWFHQQPGGPFVRAWGQSVPLARRYAKLAGLRFRRLPWLAGTAPNWQNHRFPGTASFVVELPAGGLSTELHDANRRAIVELGRRVAGRG